MIKIQTPEMIAALAAVEAQKQLEKDLARQNIQNAKELIRLNLNTDKQEKIDMRKRLMANYARKVLDKQFLLVPRPGFAPDIYQITDRDKKEVTKLIGLDSERICLARALATEADLMGDIFAPREVRDLTDYWTQLAKASERPVLMGREGSDDWCLFRQKYLPEEGDITAWKGWLDRLSDPEAFAAWIWGVYSGEYKGRQILWMHGPNGLDGKTYVQNTLGDQLFGPLRGTVGNAQLKNTQFLTSSLEGKLLVTLGDCNVSTLHKYEIIKSISAGEKGDAVTIEHKGKTAYPAKLQSRLWVNSNLAPDLDNGVHETSRILYISVAKIVGEADNDIERKVIAELPAFLYYARECFNKRCPQGSSIIKGNTLTDSLVADLNIDAVEEFQGWFENGFQSVEGDRYLKAVQVNDRLKTLGIGSTFKHRDFQKFLRQTMDCTISTEHNGVGREKRIYGLAFKEDAPIAGNKQAWAEQAEGFIEMLTKEVA